MSHKAPASTARNSIFEEETSRNSIFCFVEMSTISRITMCTSDNTENILQQINLVWSQIIEIASTRNIRLQPPRQFLFVFIVKVTRRHRESELNIDYLTDGTVLNDLLHFLEIWKITTVISHKARHTGLLADTVDTDTVVIACRQWFFYINRLSCTHCHNGKGGMRRWRRSNIDGIHIRVIYQFLSICIPFTDMVTLSITTSLVFATAHHSHNLRAFHFIEGRSALLFGYFSAADKSPIDLFHTFR